MSELLEYRQKSFSEYLRRDDVEQMKADAKAMEREVAQLDQEKKSVESRITALQDAQRRLQRFLDQLSL